jgi:hypothetical protein
MVIYISFVHHLVGKQYLSSSLETMYSMPRLRGRFQVKVEVRKA